MTQAVTTQFHDLIISAQRGEAQAVSRLIEASQTPLSRYCLRLTRDWARAQDLVQDTLVRVLEKISDLKDPSKYFAWMRHTARNLWLDFLKSPKNRNCSLDEAGGHEPLQEAPDMLARLQLERSLSTLQEMARAALLLVDGAGYSYEEAALKLQTSSASLRCRLHRARRTVQQAYVSK